MNFWDTLKASGIALGSQIVAPLSNGITQAITNLAKTGQDKVSQLATTIVQTTDPNKPRASQPSAAPTTAKTIAQAQTSVGIFAIIALVILFFYMRKK